MSPGHDVAVNSLVLTLMQPVLPSSRLLRVMLFLEAAPPTLKKGWLRGGREKPKDE